MHTASSVPVQAMPVRGRRLVLMCALLAWFCAGIMMAIPPLAARPAVAAMGVTGAARPLVLVVCVRFPVGGGQRWVLLWVAGGSIWPRQSAWLECSHVFDPGR